MDYHGQCRIFDPSRISRYPLNRRRNKVRLEQLADPDVVRRQTIELPKSIEHSIEMIAHSIRAARSAGKAVILFTGAHLVKNGMGPLVVDLVHRKLVTLVAGNGATSIHDFELALIGQTSEDVPNALGAGQFGMSREFDYFNVALQLGDSMALGFGESLGRMIRDADFRGRVFSGLKPPADTPRDFVHPEVSILAACHDCGVPMTIHVGIGTDVTDQHPSFDGRAKGGCSGRDFLIFADEVTRLAGGGVVLNIGSAVTGPEVLLKAVSMAANIGAPPKGLVTADFDLRPQGPKGCGEDTHPYYYRDQKSVVTRVPEAFGGRGEYVQGDQKLTFVRLFQKLTESQ
ncbi:MAG: hypothetical protein GX455_13230 [Phycisphaerae bacterium]|nr:hypothetical protein [Phycisphaerae bacterium]